MWWSQRLELLILTALDVWYGEVFLASHKASDHRYELRTNKSPGSLAESDLLLSPHQKVSRRLTCNEEMVFSLLGLLAGSESLVLSRRYKVVCLINSRVEVLLVGQELSEINDVLVKKCTSDDWSMLLSVSIKNCLVNGVSDILFQFFSLIVAQLANINALWKRELETSILVIVHLLLCSTTCSHLIWYWLTTCLSDSTHVLYLAALL